MKLIKKPNFIDKLLAIPYYIDLLKKYNTLQDDMSALKEKTANRLLEDYLNKVTIPEEMIKLEEENTELRTKIKELKEIIKKG